MNVLSIDFDIIMAPDINLYNPLINPPHKFEDLMEIYPVLSGCRADLEHYRNLVLYILKVAKTLDVKDIRVSYSHEDIKNVLNECIDVHVYNIDHHHDLGYPIEGKNEPEGCTCANWGDFYFENQTIKSFTWIKNSNSDDHPKYKNDLRVRSFNLEDFDLSTLPPMDKIFLCLSPEWVPPMYYPLFYNILDLINYEKDCVLEVY